MQDQSLRWPPEEILSVAYRRDGVPGVLGGTREVRSNDLCLDAAGRLQLRRNRLKFCLRAADQHQIDACVAGASVCAANGHTHLGLHTLQGSVTGIPSSQRRVDETVSFLIIAADACYCLSC